MYEWPIFSNYRFSKDRQKILCSDALVSSLDISNPALQSQLMKDFLKVKTNKDILKWTENYGFFEVSDAQDVKQSVSTESFIQAVAATRWLKKFAETIQEAERMEDTTLLQEWLTYREGAKIENCMTFRPREGEVSNFAGVLRGRYISFAPDYLWEELDVYLSEPCWSYKFSPEFIDQTLRDKRTAEKKISINPDAVTVTKSGELTWLGDDQFTINCAKEYIKQAFDELLNENGPRFSLQEKPNGVKDLIVVSNVFSPWNAVNMALFNYIAGKTNLRKCRNPECAVIDDTWTKQRHYCSEACQKVCERNGLKLRTNKSRS